MPTTVRFAITIAAAALTAGALLAGASPATASKTCNVSGQERDYGHNMYLDALSVRGTKCGKAKGVVNGYSKCRYERGGLNGHCPNRVEKYKCSEGKRTLAPHIQYSASVYCKHRSKRIKFTYTQQI